VPTGSRWRTKLKRQGMSESAVDVLESCFDTHADARPPDAVVLAAALGGLLQPPEPEAKPIRPAAATRFRPAERPAASRAQPQAPVAVWPWGLLAVVIVLIGITLALALLAGSQNNVKRNQDQDKDQAATDQAIQLQNDVEPTQHQDSS